MIKNYEFLLEISFYDYNCYNYFQQHIICKNTIYSISSYFLRIKITNLRIRCNYNHI